MSNLYDQLKTAKEILAGWSFDKCENEAERNFVQRAIGWSQKRVAELEEKISKLETKARAKYTPILTIAAQKSPELQCGRCDGQGKIRGFGHIDGGKCFACNGKGIRKNKK